MKQFGVKSCHIFLGILAILLVCLPGVSGATDMGTINSGETKNGDLSLPPFENSENSWTFNGNAGNQVLITVARITGSIEPVIYLYPPDNSGLEASATSLASHQALDHQLQKTGLYTIIIRDYSMDEEGEFSISFSKTPPEKGLGIYDPSPSDGSNVAITCGDFSWSAVAGATGYGLYFGENVIEPMFLYSENLPAASMPFPDMLPYTVYYWHVVAHTAGGDIQGPVWWFETDGCFGDFDFDGDVDGKDLSVFEDAMKNYNPVADFNDDNVVDEQDLVKFVCNFGKAGCTLSVDDISQD